MHAMANARLACSTICFRTLPLEPALAEVRQAGYEAVEIGAVPGFCEHFDAASACEADLERFLAAVRASGLQVVGYSANPGHFNAPGADRHAIVERAAADLRVAALLRLPALNVRCGAPIAERWLFHEHARRQAEGLKRVAQAAQDLGLRLNLEAPHRHGLTRTLDEAEWLLDAIHEPNVALLLDTSHVQAGGGDPALAVSVYGSRLAHVHLRDARGDEPLVLPGEGSVDFDAFFAALAAAGYEGPCVVELEGHGETLEERRSGLSRASAFLASRPQAPRSTAA
jgi:sugar phosphate isomerase/epimerase